MKVINREVRAKSFAGFLTGVCAVIGGTLTVAAARELADAADADERLCEARDVAVQAIELTRARPGRPGVRHRRVRHGPRVVWRARIGRNDRIETGVVYEQSVTIPSETDASKMLVLRRIELERQRKAGAVARDALSSRGRRSR